MQATKLVFLAVTSSGEHQQQGDPVQISPSLRNMTLWHPRIPDQSLRFLGMSECIDGPDLPICYTIFGGLSGEHLDSICGLTVQGDEDYRDRLLDITVDFVRLKRAAHFGSDSVQPSREWSFAIDGSPGERITGLDMSRVRECPSHASISRCIAADRGGWDSWNNSLKKKKKRRRTGLSQDGEVIPPPQNSIFGPSILYCLNITIKLLLLECLY